MAGTGTWKPEVMVITPERSVSLSNKQKNKAMSFQLRKITNLMHG